MKGVNLDLRNSLGENFAFLLKKKGNSYLQLTSLSPGSQQAAKLQWELPGSRDGETEV